MCLSIQLIEYPVTGITVIPDKDVKDFNLPFFKET